MKTDFRTRLQEGRITQLIHHLGIMNCMVVALKEAVLSLLFIGKSLEKLYNKKFDELTKSYAEEVEKQGNKEFEMYLMEDFIESKWDVDDDDPKGSIH